MRRSSVRKEARLHGTSRIGVAALAACVLLGGYAAAVRADAPYYVSVTLGTTNAVSGLTQIENAGDGQTTAANIGGKDCRKLNITGGSRYMYLNVADWYYPPGAGPGVTVMVEYYSANNVNFSVQYDAADGNAYKSSTGRNTGSSAAWKKAVLWLPDPRFAGHQNAGADLRIGTSTTAGDFYIASVALARPAGPYVRGDQGSDFSGPSFGPAQKVTATHYFYWYDTYSKMHFIDAPGDDGLTEHPALIPGVPDCLYAPPLTVAAPQDFSYKAITGHRREFNDMISAKIDIAMPVYWGGVSCLPWAAYGVEKMIETMDRMVEEGHNPPQLGMMYDTSTLMVTDSVFNYEGNSTNLLTEDGRVFFNKQVVDFFSLIPPKYWARINGKPLVVLYSSAFTSGYSQQTFTDLNARMAEVFGGIQPYVVRNFDWTGVTTDSVTRFGTALTGAYIAGAAEIGPGYDDRNVRTPGNVRSRQGGQTYIDDWNYVISNYTGKLVILETWSEYHEGTQIANTQEYGRQYIDLTQQYGSIFKGTWNGADNAIVLDNTVLSTMTAGKTVTATITVKNTGSNTWTDAGGYRLGVVSPPDPFYTAGNAILLPPGTSVAPGQSYTFEISMTAPASPATYTTTWRMFHNLAAFGETFTESVNVIAGPTACPDAPVTDLVTNAGFYGTGGAKAAGITGDVPDDWRAFAVSPGTGEIQAVPVAADELYPGSPATNAVLWRTTPQGGTEGSSALDKDDALLRDNIPAEERIYMALVDVRNGGPYGGSPLFNLGLQFPDGVPGLNLRGYGIVPGAGFETTGLTSRSTTSGKISARFDLGGGIERSVDLDNVRVYDVTHANRIPNGGFENSATRPLGWRAVFVNGVTGTVTISGDAHGGTNAALLSVTAVPAPAPGVDGLIDLWDIPVSVLGGETIAVSFAAKQVSGVDTNLRVDVGAFDAAGVYLGSLFSGPFNPGTTGYSTYSTGNLVLGSNAATVTVGFRCVETAATGNIAVGSYLIDDVVLIPAADAPGREGNILADGDFEEIPFSGWGTEGSDLMDVISIPSWRVFAVAGAYGGAYGISDASSGLIGLEIFRNATTPAGDSAMDKDDPSIRESIPSRAAVYKFLVDAKAGGRYGTAANVFIGSQFASGVPALNNRTFSWDPGANFETGGISAVSTTGGTLSVRLDVGGGTTPDRSALFDNARAYDVTYGTDRVVNGGFENSATRTLGWRFFAVSGATGSATLSGDANSGAQAVLLDRTNTAGDSAIDLWGGNQQVAVIPGETINVSFAAKKVAGDANTRVSMQVASFDAAGTYAGTLSNPLVAPTTTYGTFSTGNVVVPSNVSFISVGFRIMNNLGNSAIGTCLIDDVSVMGVNLAATPTNIATNGDFEADAEGTTAAATNSINTTSITAWRFFAISGASGSAKVTSAAASHGAKGIQLVRAPGVGGPDRGFDRDGQHFEIRPDRWYHAEFYIKSANTDATNQGYSFGFPLFGCGDPGYLGVAPGSVGGTATGTWQKVVAPVFQYALAGDAQISWRVVNDGGDDAILIALPSVVGTAADADNDAVPDTCDACPGTPSGTPVGPDGCPLSLCNTPQSDLNGDNSVDGADYGLFAGCFNGTGNPINAGCECADLNGDLSVDGADYGLFAGCFNGTGNPSPCM